MYLLIYKTTHSNGRYYIGRHQTNNIDDGYLGSGKWVTSIKDKSSLSREILAEAKDLEELCKLEEYHISLHYDDPNCMNLKIGSVGNTSEDAKNFAKMMLENGNHNFLGGKIQHDRVKNGTHHFLDPDFHRENNNRRIEAGTHNLLGENNPSHKRMVDGTHNFIGLSAKRVENGTHQWLGPENNAKRIEAGTHNFLGPNAPSQFIWHCEHCNKTGKGKGVFTRFHGTNCKSHLDVQE